MVGIACTFISCVLFIHLGLGDAINKVIRTEFVLFRCVKCMTFWSVLGYSLLVELPFTHSACIAFVCSYLSLWAELALGKLADKYEKLSKNVDAEEPDGDTGIRSEENQDDKEPEGFLP